jgi:cytoskeletal protein RodZ
MKTIGLILKNARVEKKLTLSHVEDVTKIKSLFIDLLEKEDWDTLPPFPTVLGFVKSIAGALEMDEKFAVAILKRDYPPKKLRITPKPDLVNKLSWGPKITFMVGVGAVLVILFGYLMVQYVRFVSPPSLHLNSPQENQVITTGNVTVFGETDSDAKVVVNNQPIAVSADGKFSIDMNVAVETKEIVVTASSRSGKVTEIRRKVSVESK